MPAEERIPLGDECPMQVEATDRETARAALHMLGGKPVTPLDVDALEILLGRVRADERERRTDYPTPQWPEMPAWANEDREDDHERPEDAEINAAFPTRSGRYDLYREAMRLVGARRSKGGLVELVNWLLHRAASEKRSDP